MDEEEVPTIYTSIFVLPSEPGKPPRALLGQTDDPEPMTPKPGDVLEGVLAIWSGDMGTWVVAGAPVPPDLGEAITDRARDLGVPGF